MKETGLSYGAGMQTFALLVLAEQKKINPDFLLFADTGAEHPETYNHIENVVKPICERLGIPFEVTVMHKEVDDISNLRMKEITSYRKMLKDAMQYKSRTDRIKFHKQYHEDNNIPRKVVTSLRDEIIARRRIPSINPQSRWCTSDAKLVPIYRDYIRPKQASGEIADPCVMIIGLSYDELGRMYKPHLSEYRVSYPLIDMKLTRADCVRIIRNAGYDVPPKSGCTFCPFQGTNQWRTLYRDHPDLYWDAVELEEMDLNFPTYRLNAHKGPLRKLAGYFADDIQHTFDELDGFDARDEMSCEQAGYCGI